MDERIEPGRFWLGAEYEDGVVIEKHIREDVNRVILQVNDFLRWSDVLETPIKRIYRLP